jgi:hypothetical protein
MSCCIDCCCDEPQIGNHQDFLFCAYNGRHQCHQRPENDPNGKENAPKNQHSVANQQLAERHQHRRWGTPGGNGYSNPPQNLSGAVGSTGHQRPERPEKWVNSFPLNTFHGETKRQLIALIAAAEQRGFERGTAARKDDYSRGSETALSTAPPNAPASRKTTTSYQRRSTPSARKSGRRH